MMDDADADDAGAGAGGFATGNIPRGTLVVVIALWVVSFDRRLCYYHHRHHHHYSEACHLETHPVALGEFCFFI